MNVDDLPSDLERRDEREHGQERHGHEHERHERERDGDHAGVDTDFSPDSDDPDGEPVSLYGSSLASERQRRAFRNGRVPVAVYGLGKMGLPLAAVYAETTTNTVGVDVSTAVVEAVNRGETHVVREPDLDALVEAAVAEGRLSARADPAAAAADASVHVIIVPTPIHADSTPDLSVLREVCADVAAGLAPGDLVCVECTVPPKTCREVVLALLADESGLSNTEFGVAFCPERTSSGQAIADIRGAYPKVVGGVDPESSRAAALVYDEINSQGTIEVSDATTAEAVKVFEGVYRDVNIALANELARFTDELGIDVSEAIDVANTLPFCDIHTPGIGVGGHCIPYYPYFLIPGFETDAPLLRTARDVNDSMPGFALAKLREEFDAEGEALRGKTVLVCGLTYRPGVNETAATPAGPLIDGLREAGAAVLATDPILANEEIAAFGADPVTLDAAPDQGVDAAVLVTAHEEFDALAWDAFDPLIVIDGRDALDLAGTNHRVYTIAGGYSS
jgi:UDP-N-acetyl-D-mannosaminuronic acid dehydrogenase